MHLIAEIVAQQPLAIEVDAVAADAAVAVVDY